MQEDRWAKPTLPLSPGTWPLHPVSGLCVLGGLCGRKNLDSGIRGNDSAAIRVHPRKFVSEKLGDEGADVTVFFGGAKKIPCRAQFALDKAGNVATLTPATCKFFTNAVYGVGLIG
jgi:hypothetical protein